MKLFKPSHEKNEKFKNIKIDDDFFLSIFRIKTTAFLSQFKQKKEQVLTV
mgnify:FL=1|jgi:hypothetical protein